jgi:CheY-like chemotaxis protein
MNVALLIGVSPWISEPTAGKGRTMEPAIAQVPNTVSISLSEQTELVRTGCLYLDSKSNAANIPHKPTPDINVNIQPQPAHSILIVEDDPDISMALHDLLEFEGFQVDCAQTCRDAFSSLEQHIYNAVLLDLGLPDGDGLSILEKLQVLNPSLPVIVLTASNRELGPSRAYARLTKPWERGELRTILQQAIGIA